MDQQKKFDNILTAIEASVQDEVGALLGSDFSILSGSRELVGKSEAFDRLLGKQICVHFDITGDIVGKGCLLVGIKDAIRLGGTLIMLPDTELQEVIGREEYREEVEDSYGEIANIITGSITKKFEEMYPKACRFIRKEQEILVPAKVVVDSDNPVANQNFYSMSSSMLLDGKAMGELVVLFPAIPFELDQELPESPVRQSETESNAAVSSEPQGIEKTEAEADQSTVDDAEEKKTAKPKIDIEKQKKKIDQLLAECKKKLILEVSSLLGTGIELEALENQIISKEDFFSDHAVGKQVFVDMEVVGGSQDTCYFSIGIKDAIYLGGTLIMLPPTELVNVVNEEDFSDDGRDAYGEVANIVSGVYTAVFEEQYREKLRFIKKELREVVPLKVVADSDDPIPNQAYYCHSMQLSVADKQLGIICMLFPARLLQLEGEAPEETVSAGKAQTEPVVTKKLQAAPKEDQPQSPSKETQEKKVPKNIPHSKETLQKQKKLVDRILAVCLNKVTEEVSALLGAEVQLINLNNSVVNKETFFLEEVSGKQVITHMDVVGEVEGKSHLVVNLRDAIRVGGLLIMLPAQELESVVSDEVFGDDTKDAYGEIANIIAGAYTSVFEEQYTKKIRFVKTDLQQVVPMKVEIESAEPFPNGHLYLSSSDLTIGGSVLGKMNVVFPLELLELEGLAAVGDEESQGSLDIGAAQHSGETAGEITVLDILLIGDDEQESNKIAAVLKEMKFAVKSLSFKDNVNNYMPGKLKAIYLVTKDVNEQAFGAAIKISAACSLPLIAAGPDWTRTKVIKAVKYGIRDILLTPASKPDIEENVTNNLLKLAA
jgi:chemotaxis protein CheY-P-specific phosphatase CheC